MVLRLLQWAVLLAALSPFAYYALAAYCGWEYFRKLRRLPSLDRSFTPPASILKPVRGLDREGYENFASFCRLDYPEYEVVFAVVEPDDPVIPFIQKLQREFPKCTGSPDRLAQRPRIPPRTPGSPGGRNSRSFRSLHGPDRGRASECSRAE